MEPDTSSCLYLADPTDRALSPDDVTLLADLATWLADLIKGLGFLLTNLDLEVFSFRTKFWCQQARPVMVVLARHRLDTSLTDGIDWPHSLPLMLQTYVSIVVDISEVCSKCFV